MAGYELQLLVRRHLPERLKVLWRAVRLMGAPPPAAPAIPQAQLRDCRLLADRALLLEHVPKGGVICELGTLHGDFAREVLARAQPSRLDLVDVTFATCDPAVLRHPSVTAHQMLTTRFLSAATPASFDLVYVDADHSYEAVKADIALAHRLVKPGGLMAFNDFARIMRPGLAQFGVHQAVCEFMVEAGWPMAFFVMNGEALYDVALRRPPDNPADRSAGGPDG
jgi:SAM-dependent methyltransferase